MPEDEEIIEKVKAEVEDALTHSYLSTACRHNVHDECRQTCKFCGGPCHCYCHRER